MMRLLVSVRTLYRLGTWPATGQRCLSVSVNRLSSAGSTPPPVVVTAPWLKSALEAKTDDLVVLDATWIKKVPVKGIPYRSGQEAFESKHIPGSVHFDVDACVTKTSLVPRSLPEPDQFQAYLRGLGVNTDSHVVFYDRDDGKVLNTGISSRSRFVFKLYGLDKLSVLNGGLTHWESLGYRTETGPAKPQKTGDFVVNFRSDLVVDFEEMQQIERSRSHQIVDTRLAPNFSGDLKEPSAVMQAILQDAGFPVPDAATLRSGHMKNAINVPYPTLYGEDKVSFKTKEELMKMFSDKGIDLTKPTVSTCFIGHTANIFLTLANFCGQDKAKSRLYAGSWTEYCQRSKAERD